MDICVYALRCAASRLGLYAVGNQAMSGEQLDQMDIGQLEKVIDHTYVFYRVSPRHKHKIVKVCEILFRSDSGEAEGAE